MSLRPVELPPPTLGPAEATHDVEFEVLDQGWSMLRDRINEGIGLANSVGAGLPRLPTGSLEELLVLPFSGDYRMIRRNADACLQVRGALATWSDNFALLGIGVASCWDGVASAALIGRLAAYAVAGRAVGELVGLGSELFCEIADVSEWLAIRVERELVELGKALVRLGERLLSLVGGPGGLAKLGLDLAVHGFSVVSHIVHDICLVLTLVHDLLDLKAKVEGWVADWRARLELFSDLPVRIAA